MAKYDRRENASAIGSRREFLGELGLALAGTWLPVTHVLADNSYPQSDVRRYGIVQNRAEAATANTAAFAALVSPAAGFSGKLEFPNTTGRDIYYFNDMIPLHDGIHLDLMTSTLNFSKVGVARDTNAGFLHAIRDFSIENGTIVVDYTHKAGFNTGNALSFGARGSDCPLFPNIYDSQLASPMGKIVVRNVQILSNADGGEGRGILMLGGLDGVLLENVTIDGQGKLLHGIYYEFGWATNEAKPYLRQTSHAHNCQVRNLTVKGVKSEGFSANGLYRAVIDGIKVSDAGGVCAFGAGESMFFRPWSGVPDRKSKPHIVIRNAVGESISNVGIGVTGASKITASYLDNPPAHDNPNGLTAVHQTDLLDFTLDTFSISGSANNYGIFTSAGRAVIRNGTLTGFQRGVVTTQDCTRYLIDSVNVLDSTSLGMQIGRSPSIYNAPRPASGVIRHCVIAGSGTAGPSAAIALGTNQVCVIEDCRFGHEPGRDGKSEKTQTQAVAISADAAEVVCRHNYVGGTADNAVAYTVAPGPGGNRPFRLVSNGGITTATGAWQAGRQGPAVQQISNNGTIATAFARTVWVTASAAVSGVSIQPGTQHGQTVIVISEAPAANAIEFGPASSSNVAAGVEPIVGLTSSILVWNGESKLWNSLS